MTARLNIVVAGDTRTTVEKTCGVGAWRTLADNGFVERTSVSCVGFHRDINSNSLLIVLPKAFSSRDARHRLDRPAYQREQIYRLIRVFRKIRRLTRLSLQSGQANDLLGRDLPSTDPVLDSFDAALQLRRDYRENGLYFKKSSRRVTNAPNLSVDWPRTIQVSRLAIQDGEMIFRETVHRARKRNIKHALSILHVTCLKEIFALTGERHGLENVEGLDRETFGKLKARPDGHLRAIRSETFDERGRFLLSAINSFLGESRLLDTQRSDREELLSYTEDFEYIWETILRDLFAPGIKSRALPTGEWYSWPDGSGTAGIQPAFDIYLVNDDSELLVDAKDYRLLNGSKWLGSSADHYKQILYRQLLSTAGNSSVVNILAFPGLGQGSLFAVRGCHRWKEIKASSVFEVTVDYDLAVKCWLRETTLDINREIKALINALRGFSEQLET